MGESMGESMDGALVNDDLREERLVQRRQLRARSLGYELDVEMSSPVALASARQDEDCEAAADAEQRVVREASGRHGTEPLRAARRHARLQSFHSLKAVSLWLIYYMLLYGGLI